MSPLVPFELEISVKVLPDPVPPVIVYEPVPERAVPDNVAPLMVLATVKAPPEVILLLELKN